MIQKKFVSVSFRKNFESVSFRKNFVSVLFRKNFVHIFVFCTYSQPNFRYSSLNFVRLVWVEPQINLQLTGKISLKLDFNSSLLLKYSC